MYGTNKKARLTIGGQLFTSKIDQMAADHLWTRWGW